MPIFFGGRGLLLKGKLLKLPSPNLNITWQPETGYYRPVVYVIKTWGKHVCLPLCKQWPAAIHSIPSLPKRLRVNVCKSKVSELSSPPICVWRANGVKTTKPGWYFGRKRRESWEAVSQLERWRRIPYDAPSRFSGLDYERQRGGWGLSVTVSVTVVSSRLWSQIPRTHINVGRVWWPVSNSSTHKVYTQHLWSKLASQITHVCSLWNQAGIMGS